MQGCKCAAHDDAELVQPKALPHCQEARYLQTNPLTMVGRRLSALQALVLATAVARLGLHASETDSDPALLLEGAWWQRSASQTTHGLLVFVRLHGETPLHLLSSVATGWQQ